NPPLVTIADNGQSTPEFRPDQARKGAINRASAGVVRANEVTHARHDLLAPLAAVEDAVVTDPRLLPVHMACTRNVGGQRMGRLGLADAGDVVELALDRHQ